MFVLVLCASTLRLIPLLHIDGQFNMLANPKNCEMVILAHDGFGRLKLDGRCELELEEISNDSEEEEGNEDGEKTSKDEEKNTVQSSKGKTSTTSVVGYNKFKRLRTLPPQYIQTRTAKMCFNDTGS